MIESGPLLEGLPTDVEEARGVVANRGWAAMMLALRLDVYRSVLIGRPVMVRLLDPEALRRALRGDPPPPLEFILITAEHLDALTESGPLRERRAA